MAKLREIKDRINSIEGTQKITNAMYMISTTKLRHAKENRENNTVYFNGLKNMLERLMRHMPDSEDPYLKLRDKKPEELVHGYLLVTSDKGLAGAYNQNILKETEGLMKEYGGGYRLFVVGENGRRYLTGHGYRIEEDFDYPAESPTHHTGRMMARTVLDLFDDGSLDTIHIIYTAMKSAMDVEVRARQILPLESTMEKKELMIPVGMDNEDFLFLPSPNEVLDAVVPNYVNGYIYSALIESFCAEQNSRMLAMQTATDAAVSITRDLTIQYNRARQGVITQEITEVSAGAEAQSN